MKLIDYTSLDLNEIVSGFPLVYRILKMHMYVSGVFKKRIIEPAGKPLINKVF